MPSDAGLVIIVNSVNITVKDLNLTSNGLGVLFAYTNSSKIMNLNASNIADKGIYLYRCYNCSINGNRILGNDRGIELVASSNNKIEGNVVSNNSWGIQLMFGLPMFGSTNNTILNNLITNNKYGINFFSDSNYNEIVENTIVLSDETGIFLSGNNNIIHNNSILDNKEGVAVSFGSSNNTISRNVILNSSFIDISMSYANSNLVLDNVISKSDIGLWARNINDCVFSGNTISMNSQGIQTLFSSNSTFYHNNFINNTLQVYSHNSTNTWDNGAEGNYWSDYNETDDDQDGIGDSPYPIDVNNQDNHPLMGMFSDFSVTHQEEMYHVITICNSTISEFQFNDIAKTISFNVTGPDYTLGFCRITIPNIIIQDLWQGNYTVLVDGKEPIMMNNWTDGTYTYIYFTYLHSEHKVVIIPEFPAAIILPLLMIISLVAVVLKKMMKSTCRHVDELNETC